MLHSVDSKLNLIFKLPGENNEAIDVCSPAAIFIKYAYSVSVPREHFN